MEELHHSSKLLFEEIELFFLELEFCIPRAAILKKEYTVLQKIEAPDNRELAKTLGNMNVKIRVPSNSPNQHM